MSGEVLLVDTGFFIALYDARDPYHNAAYENREWLEMLPIVVPWPILYETVNTRFAKKRESMARFDGIIRRSDTILLDDTIYRGESYQTVMDLTRENRPLSLVDVILRAIIEDRHIILEGKPHRISTMLTFNHRDFRDFCWQHSVELPLDKTERSMI